MKPVWKLAGQCFKKLKLKTMRHTHTHKDCSPEESIVRDPVLVRLLGRQREVDGVLGPVGGPGKVAGPVGQQLFYLHAYKHFII